MGVIEEGHAKEEMSANKGRLPPKRGHIKVVIMEGFLKFIRRTATQIRRGLSKKKQVARDCETVQCNIVDEK